MITYRTTTGASLNVYLDGARVGAIRTQPEGFTYQASGGANGDSFESLEDCKASVEGREEGDHRWRLIYGTTGQGWNADRGCWVNGDDYSAFTDAEKATAVKPDGGVWVHGTTGAADPHLTPDGLLDPRGATQGEAVPPAELPAVAPAPFAGFAVLLPVIEEGAGADLDMDASLSGLAVVIIEATEDGEDDSALVLCPTLASARQAARTYGPHYGGADVFQLVKIPDPAPNPDTVEVRTPPETPDIPRDEEWGEDERLGWGMFWDCFSLSAASANGADYARGWWLAYARAYGMGVRDAIRTPADGDVVQRYPQFSPAWEAWARGVDEVNQGWNEPTAQA